MKVPFRQQATEYDCVPTAIINAMCYLFDRRELPPSVVHRIYKDCLDYESARGTSGRAIRDVGTWLSCYAEKKFATFAVASRFICGSQVHVKRNSQIIRWLNDNGTALLCIQISQYERHCVMGMHIEDDWLYCHDPYPRTKRYATSEAIQFVEPASRQGSNLKIRLDWLENDSEHSQHADSHKYVLGSIDERECLLLKRIRR